MSSNRVKLCTVCKINNGYAFKSDDYKNTGVPLIRISNFDDGEVLIDDKTIYVDQVFISTRRDFIVEKGDILIALSGATTGKYGIYNYDFPSLLNQRIGLIKSGASTKLFGKYFYHYLNVLKEEILRNAGGAAQPNISTKTIGDLQIPLPPLDVQQKIASILDAADTLRQKDKALLAKYDELTQALFLDMFGDPVSNPKGWEKKSFDEMVKFDTKMTKDFDKYGDFLHVGIGNIQKSTGKIIDCLTAKEEKLTSGKYLFDNRHIIYSKIRPNLNKVALPDFTGLCSADSYPLLPIQGISNRVFIAYILRSECFLDFILQHSTRTNIPKANRAQMKLFIGFCPPIELQTQFAERVAIIEQQKAQAHASLVKSEELFNSLLQKAFKGELV
jgi:type I restriction enzyme S subunit